jgi:hypothetical protein
VEVTNTLAYFVGVVKSFVGEVLLDVFVTGNSLKIYIPEES